MLHVIRTQLMSRPFLWLLFICNLLGTIYGFYWYRNQMEATEWYWNFFVPDSPTSSGLFTLLILLWLLKKSSPLLEMLSMVTNIKYGIWACGVIFTYGAADGAIEAQNWMLVLSHGAMAVEVLLYNFAYKFDWRWLWVGAVWLLFNDFVDYVYGIHPYLQDGRFLADVTFWTPVLSVATLLLVAMLRPKARTNWHV
ncbi:hypothetical protein CIG75_11405 [Tumebacillus algifaecis]|uniref:DUF1405 domain-containing protein n=1 Tax=Tumebacillus algifaecis TaxID=1214604 RepID=A0A223D1R0_9BACL|nr:DUF1405 domain-containing protein [Tumebacillus algifaecis]ASS75530.1 hypothetical protein CIG75_11405 [Tumebacillus algifaecis]